MNKRMALFATLSIISIIGITNQLNAQEKPNILWLTCEDMSYNYLSCYGGTAVHTPNLDSFAAKGIKFKNAYSNGPQCSPARTTLVTGCYASSLGAEWHRADRALPEDVYWTKLLTQAGYFCASKGKMADFNANNTLPKDIWNEGNSYADAPANTPWFSIANFYDTHMSWITKTPVASRKNRKVSKEDVTVWPYVPDIDSVRDDLAWHFEAVKNLDVWFGNQLQDLENSGQADNTIIFFFSDHGGSLPNSKGYLNQAGTKVPFMVYFPDKWKHLAGVEQPSEIDSIVQFVDFGPSVLSIAGIKTPEKLQGKPFVGQYKEAKREYAYLFKANQGHNFIPARAITDNKFKFIWNYNTAFPAGARQDFQWLMPSYRGWEDLFRKGQMTGAYKAFWEPSEPFELYDLQTDPYEANNLANDPAYAQIVEFYKAELQSQVRENMDIGLYPKSMRDYRKTPAQGIFYDYVRQNNYDLNTVIAAAEFASTAQAEDTTALLALIKDQEPAVRYWGSLGFFQLARKGKISEVPQYLSDVMKDETENDEVRLNCAAAIIYTGELCYSLDLMYDLWTAKTSWGRAYIQNIEDKAAPISRKMYDYYLNDKDFHTRSPLINAGIFDYKYLLADPPSSEIDETNFALEDLMKECSTANTGCNEIIEEETFDGTTLPAQWSEQNTNGNVGLENGRLYLDYSADKPLVTKTISPVSGNVSINFTLNSERNWFEFYVSFKDQDNNTCAQILFGNNASKNIFLATELGADGLASSSVSLLNGDFVKFNDYRIETVVNTAMNTLTLYLNGEIKQQALDIPLLSETNSISAVEFHFVNMYGNSKKVYIDDFSLKSCGANTNGITQLAISEKQARIKLFPNPCNGSGLNIRLLDFDLDDTSELSIFDIRGEKVYSSKIETLDYCIELKLKAGLYNVVAKGENKLCSEKLLIE